MAKIIVCDRCGKQVPDVPDFCNIKMSIYPNGYKGYELCSDCAKALQEWVAANENMPEPQKQVFVLGR